MLTNGLKSTERRSDIMLCWIVPDTNLLIAGSLFPFGAGGFVLNSWRSGKVGFVLSMPILDELEGVLRRNEKIITRENMAKWIREDRNS